MKNRFFMTILLLGSMAEAQNIVPMLHASFLPDISQTGIRYGETPSDSVYIKWSRTAEVDSFWVYKGNLSLQYITNANTRIVWYNQPIRYERRMALHHLREFIFDSPFRFNDLEGLAKNQNPTLADKFIW